MIIFWIPNSVKSSFTYYILIWFNSTSYFFLYATFYFFSIFLSLLMKNIDYIIWFNVILRINLNNKLEKKNKESNSFIEKKKQLIFNNPVWMRNCNVRNIGINSKYRKLLWSFIPCQPTFSHGFQIPETLQLIDISPFLSI